MRVMYQEKKINRVPFVSSGIERTPMRLMHNFLKAIAQRQPRKGTKAGKERRKGRQGKAQRQARKGTKAGKERHKSRQEKPKFKIKIINPINLYRKG